MIVANIIETKTRLCWLLQQVAHGEEVLITKAGKPIAKLVPYETRKAVRKPGSWQGRITVADDFDAI